MFENSGTFIIDRALNRRVAFGSGIHRCVGSNLARLEMQVSLQAFVERIGEFTIETPRQVAWAGSLVRGSRILPISFSRPLRHAPQPVHSPIQFVSTQALTAGARRWR